MDKDALRRMRVEARAKGQAMPGLEGLPGGLDGVPANLGLGLPEEVCMLAHTEDGQPFKARVVVTHAFADTAMKQMMHFVANADWFRMLFNNVTRLHERNARHIKKDEHISDWSLKDMCRHLSDEADELYKSEGKSISEAADVLLVLYGIVVRNGWFLEDLHRQAQMKLEARFAWDDDLTRQTIDLMQKTGEMKDDPPNVDMKRPKATEEPETAERT
jgi:hypothetical protein